MRKELAVLLVLGLAIAGSAAAREAPSVPRVDAPELAKLGNSAVGVTTLELVDAARADRRVMVDLWYPAVTAAGSKPVTYEGSLTAEPPAAQLELHGPAPHEERDHHHQAVAGDGERAELDHEGVDGHGRSVSSGCSSPKFGSAILRMKNRITSAWPRNFWFTTT